MTIRALFEGAASSSAAERGTALAFVLNAEFLPGLKTLLSSMYQHKTLIDLPVLIITENAELLNDPFVEKVCDRSRLISEEEIDPFRGISSKLVEKRLRLSWIPKYTYLKWMMFDDYGFEQLIFIDADIVCLNRIDELLELREADLYGCPVFARDLIDPDKDPEATSRNVMRFALNPTPASSRLNTGVLVVNKNLLSRSFRERLIQFTTSREFSVEQAALRTFLRKKCRGYRMISPTYNFKYSYLQHVAPKDRFFLLSKIRLFHFAGAPVRPWEKKRPETLEDHVWAAFT